MSITYGFYNSLNGDRKYNATQMSRIFEGIINDGVFASIGSSLQVTAGTGMTVNVGTGRAWFNNTWTDNDAILPLTIEQSDVVLNRIDAVVLEIGSSSDVRENTIKIVKGTAASVPANPTLIKTTGQYQYPLAYIYVGAGVTSITQDKITSKINTTECPTVKVVGVDGLIPLWEDEFNAWFADIQSQLSGDVATNLQNQINANKNTEIANKPKYATCDTASATAAKVATQAEFSLVTGVIVGVKFTNINTASDISLNVNNTGAKPVYYAGATVGVNKISGNMIALFQYDGTNWQLLNPAEYANTTYLSATAQTLFGVSDVDSALQKAAPKTPQIVTITSSQNFTVPAGVYEVDAFLVNGGYDGTVGGASASNDGAITAGGGIGGKGGKVSYFPGIKVTPGELISAVIGAKNGGVSSFGSYSTSLTTFEFPAVANTNISTLPTTESFIGNRCPFNGILYGVPGASGGVAGFTSGQCTKGYDVTFSGGKVGGAPLFYESGKILGSGGGGASANNNGLAGITNSTTNNATGGTGASALANTGNGGGGGGGARGAVTWSSSATPGPAGSGGTGVVLIRYYA